MIGIIILLISTAIGYYNASKGYFNDLEDKIFGGLLGLMAGCFVIMFLVVPVTFFTKETGYKSTGYIPIASVKDKSGIQGEFCLGSGYINTTQYYYAMRKLSKNSYRPLTINANEVRSIDEDDSGEPCIEVFKNTKYNNVIHYLIPFVSGVIDSSYQYTFIVPKGTVITKYQVN